MKNFTILKPHHFIIALDLAAAIKTSNKYESSVWQAFLSHKILPKR